MPLVMKQLLPDKSKGKLSGTCPFCKGNIIKNDTITDKNTIIVRRYKTKNKNYWEDVDVIKKEVKTFFNNKLPKDATNENYWYTEIVRDSSKAAIPKLLPPESHPDGLRAPCCFKFKGNEVIKGKYESHHTQDMNVKNGNERQRKDSDVNNVPKREITFLNALPTSFNTVPSLI